MNKAISVNCKIYFEMLKEGFVDTGEFFIDKDCLYHLMTTPNDNN